MARYIIEGDGFVRINETYGTIENLSDFEGTGLHKSYCR